MSEQAYSTGTAAYSVPELLADLRHGVWTELMDRSPRVDFYRRALQRNYVLALIGLTNNKSSDLRARAIGELRTELAMLRKGGKTASEDQTRLHFDDLRQVIEEALMHKTTVVVPASSPTQFPFFPGGSDDPPPPLKG